VRFGIPLPATLYEIVSSGCDWDMKFMAVGDRFTEAQENRCRWQVQSSLASHAPAMRARPEGATCLRYRHPLPSGKGEAVRHPLRVGVGGTAELVVSAPAAVNLLPGRGAHAQWPHRQVPFEHEDRPCPWKRRPLGHSHLPSVPYYSLPEVVEVYQRSSVTDFVCARPAASSVTR
jgi:hypothetical protein